MSNQNLIDSGVKRAEKPTWGLTEKAVEALDYIGSHRKTKVKPGLKSCRISVVTINRLIKLRWVMKLTDGSVMLTAEGERRWTQRHPTSKYRIK